MYRKILLANYEKQKNFPKISSVEYLNSINSKNDKGKIEQGSKTKKNKIKSTQIYNRKPWATYYMKLELKALFWTPEFESYARLKIMMI
jgi:hypothetical protein